MTNRDDCSCPFSKFGNGGLHSVGEQIAGLFLAREWAGIDGGLVVPARKRISSGPVSGVSPAGGREGQFG